MHSLDKPLATALACSLFAAVALASNPSPSDAGAPSVEWPEARSPEPHSNEWDAAAPVAFTRTAGARASACVASRVREWLRVRCPALRVSAINQVGGDVSGTRFGIDPKGQDGTSTGAEVVLPLRREQQKVLMFWGVGPGYDGPLTVMPALVLQTSWLGQSPFIGLYDAVHEPVRTAASERRKLAAERTEVTW